MQHTQDDTSRALLAAAHRLLAAEGPAALTVRRIATEAGMSTMNVYSRFGGKDGVLDELYLDGFRRLREVLEAIPETDDARHDITQIANNYRSFALDNPAYYDVMFSRTVAQYKPSPEAAQFALGSLATMANRVDHAQSSGLIPSGPGRDSLTVTAWLWAMLHGLVSLELEGLGDELVSWATVFENGVKYAVQGLGQMPEISSAN